MRESFGIVFPIDGLAAFGHVKSLFYLTDKTAVNFVGGGRLAAIRYDRDLDILTFVGEEQKEGEA